MIKILIKKQLKADPIIEFFENDDKIPLIAENLTIMQNSTSFEIDVNVKK